MLRHHLPINSVQAFSHHYRQIPCVPCSGKSRFDLVYSVYFDCKYFTLLYFIYVQTIRMSPRNLASKQNPCGDNYYDDDDDDNDDDYQYYYYHHFHYNYYYYY